MNGGARLLNRIAMPRSVKGDILYPFATLSFIAVVLIGVAVALLAGRDIEVQARDSAANTAAASVVAVLQPKTASLDLSAPLSGTSLDQLQQTVAPFIFSGHTQRLRIFNRQGLTVYSSDSTEMGRTPTDQQPVLGALGEKTTGTVLGAGSNDGGLAAKAPVLDVFTPLYSNGRQVAAAVEIQQDFAATASSIASAQRVLYFEIGMGLLVLFALLQAGAWGVTRALAKDHARLTYLYQTGEHVRSSLDTQEVLSQVVRDATLVVQGEYSVVCLVDPESRALAARASYDSAQGSVAQHNREVQEWLFHRVLATGETNLLPNWRADYRRVFCVDVPQQPMAVLCVPMKLRRKATGVIAVLRRASANGFGRAEVTMLEELAGQAAMAIEQANLFARVRSYASELELSYDATLKALSAALDAKDAATEGHSERVAKLTVAIAREMQVPEEKLVDVERGAMLHDVGKIGVPDEVLRKPSTLTHKEWQAMKKHPLLAGALVSKVGFLEGALPILLYHHERYDGRGYPFGLAADRIPLEARIFAVVDAYDAMTSDRPYRRAVSHEAALKEITTNSGSQFDPDAVDAFLRVIDRLQTQFEEQAA
jgi:HD-GYP domain-containing protein (c-di-GMP phosphodiesterase class II)